MDSPLVVPRRVAALVGMLLLGPLAQAQSPASSGPSAPPSGSPAAAAPAVAPSATEASRAQAFADFRRAFESRRYDEALPLAERVVAESEALYGPEDRRLVNAVANLGTVLFRQKNYAAAEASYRRALAIAEARTTAADRILIAPLHGLGEALFAQRRVEDAALVLDRAVDLSRNLDGLFNVEQLPILETLIDTYVDQGRFEEAEKEHQYAFRVAEQAYGREDLRLLAPIDRFARWFEYVGRYSTARGLHARALQLVESRAGRNSALAAPALRGLARTYYLEFLYGPEVVESTTQANDPFAPVIPSNAAGTGRLNPDGERALRLALDALRQADPPDRAGIGGTLVELGDWYLIGNSTARAIEAYREGWKELAAAGGDATQRLTQPRRLFYRPSSASLERARPSRPEEYEERQVVVRLRIGADGRVLGAETASSTAPPAIERAVVGSLRRARYAPRLENGEPVEAADVLHTERVIVRREESPAASP